MNGGVSIVGSPMSTTRRELLLKTCYMSHIGRVSDLEPYSFWAKEPKFNFAMMGRERLCMGLLNF